ncbi:MAG: serpin family protein [Bdellovibrionales bacterium]|nr:serpin family protein [Bdellovibrionales bacterium]
MKTTVLLLAFACLSLLIMPECKAADEAAAAKAINQFGLDLLRARNSHKDNLLLSPYSIQTTLAMAYAGSAGETKSEMEKVLHLGNDEEHIHYSFAALKQSLVGIEARTSAQVKEAQKWEGAGEPFALAVANKLFGQKSFAFREPFLELLENKYGAALEEMDFIKSAPAAISEINQWVAQQTHRRILNLLPLNSLNSSTRLVLVNAIYMKAPWEEPFIESATKPGPFQVNEEKVLEVPMMTRQGYFRYKHQDGLSLIAVPYIGHELQFLVILPDHAVGLKGLEARLTPQILEAGSRASSAELVLQMPKFRLEPPLLALGQTLQTLGMKSAFNNPGGSANFDRAAARNSSDYLSISEVFHKTFIAVDEKGTEAAAATALGMERGALASEKPQPIEVRIDRPFLFAVQHIPSGACLFLGRVVDPR